MYQGKPVIDVHGHMSTPPHFRASAMNLISLRMPGVVNAPIPEAAMKNSLDRHLRMLDERHIDVQLLSPRPVAMLHWEQTRLVEAWTKATNRVIAEQCALHPTRFVGVGQLPQSPQLNIKGCVSELTRCVKDLNFVGAILNPDPGADRQAPGLDSEEWFPLYEKAEELRATLVVHPSISRDPRLAIVPQSHQYNNMTEETLATLLLENSDVFERFPKLRMLVCHCGGCLRRIIHKGETLDAINPSTGPDNVAGASGERAGGQAGGAPRSAETDEPAMAQVKRDLSDNLFFDTCAYDPWYLSAAIHQRGVRVMAFGTEAPGSGSAITNPQTGKPCDDLLATIDSFSFLSEQQKLEIVHHNPLRMFPLLAQRLSSPQRLASR